MCVSKREREVELNKIVRFCAVARGNLFKYYKRPSRALFLVFSRVRSRR